MRLPPAFASTQRWAFGALAALFAASCSSEPKKQPKTPPAQAASSSTSTALAPPITPARWLDAEGATLVGPTTPRGTLVLLGGRRMLVASDGTIQNEPAAAPEALLSALYVADSSGVRRLVAHSRHAVYRLDEPLGEAKVLARTEGAVRISRLAAGPGAVAVWLSREDTNPEPTSADPRQPPIYVDLVEPGIAQRPSMPAMPPIHMAFLNQLEGAAVFPMLGVAVTSDGGATWRHAGRLDRSVVDALSKGADVRLVAGKLKLEKSATDSKLAEETPLVKWIRRTRTDPLAAAAKSGVLLPSGEALVAAVGMLARVDLKTGLVSEVKEVSDAPEDEDGQYLSYDETRPARAGDRAWFSTTVSEPSLDRAIFSVDLKTRPFLIERDRSLGDYISLIGTSPGGGVMVPGLCDPRNQDYNPYSFCVRRGPNQWRSVRLDVDPFTRGAAPLADGRIVYLRGVDAEDLPPQDLPQPARSAAPSTSSEEPEAPPAARKSWFVAMDSCGAEETLATLEWISGEDTPVAVEGVIQEARDGALLAVLRPENERELAPYVVLAHKGEVAPVKLRPAKDLSWAKLSGDLGVVGAGRLGLRASADGGVTWTSMPTPKALEGRLVIEDELDPGQNVIVSEVGLSVGTFARLGWGPPEPYAEPQPPEGGAPLRQPYEDANASVHKIVCAKQGPASGVGPPARFFSSSIGSGTTRWWKQALPKNSREPSFFDKGGDAIMLVDGSSSPGGGPVRWRFDWLDHDEFGSRTRSVVATPPKDYASQNVRTLSRAISRERALFSFRAGTKNIVVRTKGAGIEIAEVKDMLLPSPVVAFGKEKGEPIVWTSGGNIVVWTSGDKPRVIATFEERPFSQGGDKGFGEAFPDAYALGEPTSEGVPVMIAAHGGSLVKVVGIPAPRENAATGSAVHPRTVWLNDWSRVAFDPHRIASLPPCSKDFNGRKFSITEPGGVIRLVIDAIEYELSVASYDVRVNKQAACVAGLTGNPYRRPMARGIKPGFFFEFIRYDVIANKAEGGAIGLPPPAEKGKPKPPPQVLTLSCKYEVAK